MMKSGQILILVLLIVVVALAVGLSVASRNITNLRTSTQTEQSQRAFTAAEGGVEDVLSRLTTIKSDPNITSANGLSLPVDVNSPKGKITANVNVKASSVYQVTLKPSEVGQIDLSGYTGDLKIEWIKLGSQTANENTSPKASLELTIVCPPGSSCFGSTPSASGYSQKRFALASESNSNQSGLTYNGAKCAGTDFLCSYNLSDLTSGVNLSNNATILRVRPFWNNATVRITGLSSGLKPQTYDINSVATSEIGVTRRVQVQRTALPQLPAAFDYVLFSETGINK